jgi:phage tail-like protein
VADTRPDAEARQTRREQPYTGSNFLVDLGDGDPRSAAGGFAEVVFPPFLLDRPPFGPRDVPADATAAASVPSVEGSRLILRRGATGRLDLYRWWDETRRATTPKPRTVTVQLLADDHETVVLTWRFERAYPVGLSYSPLRAMDAGVVMETLELAFDRVEMATTAG